MRKKLEAIERALSFICRFADWVAGGLIIVLTLDIFLEVVFRYLLNMPIQFSSELAMILFPWMILLSATMITWKDEHIGIVVIRRAQTGMRRKIIELVINLTMLVFSSVLLYAGWFLAWGLRGNTLPISGLSKMILYISVPTAFAVIVLILVARILHILLTDFDAESGVSNSNPSKNTPIA